MRSYTFNSTALLTLLPARLLRSRQQRHEKRRLRQLLPSGLLQPAVQRTPASSSSGLHCGGGSGRRSSAVLQNAIER